MTNAIEEQMIAKTQGYLNAKKNAEAKVTADELAEVDPKDAIVWYLKGKVHYSLGEYDEALASLSKAASIQNDHPDIWLVMGYTLIAQRRYPEAQQPLEYVKAIRPSGVEATCALGIMHAILGDGEKAKQYVSEALALDKGGASTMLENLYKQFVADSPQIEAGTKELLKNLIEKARLGK